MKKLITLFISMIAVFTLSVTASAANSVRGAVEGVGDAVGGVVEGAGEVINGVSEDVNSVADNATENNNTETQNKVVEDFPNDEANKQEILGATDDRAANPSTGVGIADLMIIGISTIGLVGVAASSKKHK